MFPVKCKSCGVVLPPKGKIFTVWYRSGDIEQVCKNCIHKFSSILRIIDYIIYPAEPAEHSKDSIILAEDLFVGVSVGTRIVLDPGKYFRNEITLQSEKPSDQRTKPAPQAILPIKGF